MSKLSLGHWALPSVGTKWSGMRLNDREGFEVPLGKSVLGTIRPSFRFPNYRPT